MNILFQEILHYAVIWIAFLRASFARGLQFRSDFFFRILMDCFYYAVNLGFFEVLLHHTSELGSLNTEQTRIFVAGFLFMDGLYMTFFSSSLWLFPDLIRKGNFDYTLVRPVSSFFLTVFRDFSVGSFFNFLIACAILTYQISTSSYAPSEVGSWLSVSLYILFLLVGTSIMLATRLLFLVPAFWFTQVDALRDLSWSIQNIGERPSGVYPDRVRFVFTYIVPVLTAFALPSESFLLGWPLDRWLPLTGVAVLFWGVLLFFWKQGTRAYSSASS